MSELNLLPCPFCSAKAIMYIVSWKTCIIGCDTYDCYCNPSFNDLPKFKDKNEAISAWNRRTTQREVE